MTTYDFRTNKSIYALKHTHSVIKEGNEDSFTEYDTIAGGNSYDYDGITRLKEVIDYHRTYLYEEHNTEILTDTETKLESIKYCFVDCDSMYDLWEIVQLKVEEAENENL